MTAPSVVGAPCGCVTLARTGGARRGGAWRSRGVGVRGASGAKVVGVDPFALLSPAERAPVVPASPPGSVDGGARLLGLREEAAPQEVRE